MIRRLVPAVFGLFLCAGAACAVSPPVRKPAVAGLWYEASPAALKAQVERLLAETKGKCPVNPAEPPLALVVPHAGYVYSGPTAAAAFNTLRGGGWTRVILLGPSHRAMFKGAAIPEVSAFETPLGPVPLDRAACDALKARAPFSVRTDAHEKEHCLECQLPFLQVLLPGASIVPILVGAAGPPEQQAIAAALMTLMDRKTLLVVSSDFTHYGDNYGFVPFRDNVRENLRKWNLECAQAITSLNRARFERHLIDTRDTVCGAAPILVAMRVLSEMAKREKVKGMMADYTTSGDKTGDWSFSVSYLSLVFVDPPATPAPPAAPKPALTPGGLLTADEQSTLLKLARKTLKAYLSGGAVPPDIAAGLGITPTLKKPLGAFVTLKKNGELRGCIGYMMAVKPLHEAVTEMAVNAATRDPRFPPVTERELRDIRIEISVLSPLSPCPDFRAVKIGVHGLVLKKGANQGLFLPQVPVEWKWNLTQYLEQLCHKAGLPPNAYKEPGALLFTFTAEVFHEK